ncbi:SHOCT domain-containing protein [Halomicrobium sp. LC1Hm]|uniref:SHOCT domain-containing protein n=2 Tax=unclassified Halomicrobium TaxID=2610901 RepID=UPI001298522C|nr:SHOCT domain-containing protein [Halomicrobium sp. LC1Hm]
MFDPFPMRLTRLLPYLMLSTFVVGIIGAVITGIPQVMGAIFVLGFLIVAPVVAVLGDSLSFVADRREESLWRSMGEEFSKGKNLVDDADLDPYARLREQYVSGEISEGEFEERLEELLEAESDSRWADERTRVPEVE